ncbi:GNAT family N-acetyltransferase [Rhodococcus sp. 14-2470-1b]|uniref:GNAT family N-acetyltransferase n=1 Tax=Rhodococcus sp. 14-2470-1b TaxID=2023149 RepID=UPI0020CF2B52|nr:GNAT family N-acetyltransferase [Rhodococcus sp. 14-2470-1b]
MATIRPGTAADAGEIGEIFSEAFEDDPVWAAHLPDSSSRRRALAEFYASEVESEPEHVDVAVDEDGQLLGALIWEPPGSREESDSFSPTEAGQAHDRAIDDQRPDEPHWYIHDIAAPGTSPRHRSRHHVDSAPIGPRRLRAGLPRIHDSREPETVRTLRVRSPRHRRHDSRLVGDDPPPVELSHTWLCNVPQPKDVR